MSIIFEPTDADIGIIMGSQSDWDIMEHCAYQCDSLSLAYETYIISAHRTPERMIAYCQQAQSRGLKIIIAGAGGAAHLPGMCASHCLLPVIGVPIASSFNNGLDSLLSINQMPRGIPVATMAVGKAGAINAAIMAMKILALSDTTYAEKNRTYYAQLSQDVALKPR